MEYLQKEFDEYIKGRNQGKSFEEIFPLKAHAFRSLYNQIGNSFSRSKVLEVGCGSGYFLSLLALNGNKSLGIDIDPLALEYAKEIFKEKRVKGDFALEDGFNLSLDPNSFDFVFNVGVLEHFDYEKQVKFLRNMSKVSNKHVLISTPNDNDNSLYQNFRRKSAHYIPEEENLYDLEKLAREVGLVPIRKGGFHIIARDDMCNETLKRIYESKGFVPKKDYSAADLENLLGFESSFSDEELSQISFLKYLLAEKIT
jgi:2-polyprenyl-3-methyl-5-hydroxy-6-metoxy-1,4-benzoquinol methylase